MSAIYITDATDSTKRYELERDEVVLLGSGEECEIRIEGTEGVAAQHCELLWDEEYFILNTCTDELKVRVNDELHDCVALVLGVEYYIGDACLLYMESEEDERAYLEDEDEESPDESEPDETESDEAADIDAEEQGETPSAAAPVMTRRSAAPARLKKKPVPGASRKKKKKVRPRTVIRSTHRRGGSMRSSSLRARRTVVRPTVAAGIRLKPRRRAVTEPMGEDLYALDDEEPESVKLVMSIIKPLYVLAVLAMAFIAGLTVHHLVVTGQFYPTADIESQKSK